MDCGLWPTIYSVKDTVCSLVDKWYGNTIVPPSRQLEMYMRNKHLEYRRQQKAEFGKVINMNKN
jgi:hypothetical protein